MDKEKIIIELLDYHQGQSGYTVSACGMCLNNPTYNIGRDTMILILSTQLNG